METCGKMPLRITFLCKAKRQSRLRVGSIITAAYIRAHGDKSSLPCKGVEQVCHRRKSVRSSVLYGWEDDVKWRLALTGERRLAACPNELEKQVQVAGQTVMQTRPTP